MTTVVKAENSNQAPQEKYQINSAENKKEALGFLKDWVSTLVTVQTAIIGAIAALLKFDATPVLTRSQAGLIYLALACFIFSIISGGYVLNMLPGCAQRTLPQNEDVYSMKTRGSMTLGNWANLFRYFFLAGIVLSGVFIVVRTLPH